MVPEPGQRPLVLTSDQAALSQDRNFDPRQCIGFKRYISSFQHTAQFCFVNAAGMLSDAVACKLRCDCYVFAALSH